MLTLTILRHAKSSWDHPGLDDRDRPLNERGLKAAPRIGRHMAELGLRPDLIVCSTAERTRQTLALVLPELGRPQPPVSYEDELYLAEADVLLNRLRSIRGAARHVLLIGHNPGLHDLAVDLAGSGDRKSLVRLAVKLPTAGLAVMEFAAAGDDWSAIAPGDGHLATFATPKSLEE